MTKIITIDSTRYVIPEGMSNKEVQSLCGALITLVKVDYEYCYGEDVSSYYATEGAIVSLGNMVLTTREEAKAKGAQSRAKYEAKQAAEKAAKAAA